MFGKQTALKVHNTLKKSTEFDDSKLVKAKEYPIEKLYPGKLVRTGKVLMGNCVFHQENTPSFAIYPETNTYTCFGCRSSGDVITFYMRLKNCNFQTAVESLI
jgi:DNA primase